MEKNTKYASSSNHGATQIRSQKQTQREQNLGGKMARIFHQNTDLSDKINAENQMPSEKLKKDPVMALVTKTVATYMFIKHSNNDNHKSNTEDLSSWDNPFFKNKDVQRRLTKQSSAAADQQGSTKTETHMECFIQKLAMSPFPIQTIRTVGKALSILTGTAPKPSQK